MPHEMKGFKELKDYNGKKREEMEREVSGNDRHIAAAMETKRTMARISDKERGAMIAWAYSRSLYMSGLSGDRVL